MLQSTLYNLFDIRTHLLRELSQLNQVVLFLGGYWVKATPGPFSNPEVKLLFADDTAAYGCGKVGRRRVLLFNLS